jgi:Flp pilus assembly protein TadD
LAGLNKPSGCLPALGREPVAHPFCEQDRSVGQEQPAVAQVRGQRCAQFPGGERVEDDRAEEQLRKVIDRNPVEHYAHLMLGRALERQARHEEAGSWLRMAAAFSGGFPDDD